MKRIAVYCGSATPADPVYIEAARNVGRTLAERGIGVVYGGGKLGLMGAVADAALAAGGEVIGVIPELVVSAEVAHRGLSELHVVDTMHERKARFTELADGFLNLPGGTGTMDELWEALSWAQLGYHTDPVGLLNVAGYYDRLVEFWEGQRAVNPTADRPLRASNLIRWLTGATYYLFGRDLLAAYFLFGLVALVNAVDMFLDAEAG